MTEDEAFIRMIVANPGDDAPRLIYADWLEERGDSRGEYLRAGVTWMPRLHEVETREKAERQLRHAARLLDPVWVARVTVPPFGICCDRVSWNDRGSSITNSRIDQLESRLQIRLPSEYKAFLLNYNGGCPHPSVYEIQNEGYWYVQDFFSLGESLSTLDGKSFADRLEVFAERMSLQTGGMQMFPIAAVVESSSSDRDEEIKEEIERRDPAWYNQWETCLCIWLKTHHIVCVQINLSDDRPGTMSPSSVVNVARSLGVLFESIR